MIAQIRKCDWIASERFPILGFVAIAKRFLMTASAHSLDRSSMSRYLATAHMHSRAIRSGRAKRQILPAGVATDTRDRSTRMATTRDHALSIIVVFGAESLQG